MNLTEYNENNNVSNNVRRRKALTGPRKVIQEFTPIDLSGSKPDSEASERLSHDSELLSQESETKNDSDNSDSDDFNTENYRTSENEEAKEDSEGISEENDSSKIPSSFSIHNLSKPHVAEQAQNLTADQISEMRSYAMNTMRELLGIYGLTSEVAESISRQLPLAAFTSGKYRAWNCLTGYITAIPFSVSYLTPHFIVCLLIVSRAGPYETIRTRFSAACNGRNGNAAMSLQTGLVIIMIMGFS